MMEMRTSLNQYQTATTMKERTQVVPTNAGTMIIALVTENAPLGAGATENRTATAHLCRTSVRLTNHKTEEVPTVAGTLWSATARELAQPGAGATVPPTVETYIIPLYHYNNTHSIYANYSSFLTFFLTFFPTKLDYNHHGVLGFWGFGVLG